MHGSCPTQWKSHSRALVVAGLCWAMLGLSDRVEAAIVSFSSWTTWQTHWNENTTNTDDLIVTFPGAVPGTLTVANEAGGDPPLVGPSSLAIDDWAYWFRGGVGSAEQGSGGIFDSTSKVVVFGDNQNVFQTNLDDDPNLSGVVDVENAVFSGITLPAGSSGTLYVLGAARRGNTTEPLTFSVAGSDASGTAGEGSQTASTADRQTGFLTFTWDATSDVSDVTASLRMSAIAATNPDWSFLGFAAALGQDTPGTPEPAAGLVAWWGIVLLIGSLRAGRRRRRRR